jgi:hypothetical protein
VTEGEKSMTNKKRRYALAALLAAIVATAGFAFTNTNTVAGSYAGDGTGTVSGYSVDQVSWDLNDADPTLIDDVTFDTNNAANEVRVRIVESTDGTSPWTSPADCTEAAGDVWTCDLTGLDADTVQVTGLEVASAS